ncbi:MAG: hypothetical protein R3208_21325, partial [Ketobacteraceae bacterium]|nr:hypothetical protein [Ketobacteraceae bacterium]
MAELEQRVNFYRDEFKKPDIKLPARQMFQMVVLVMVGFLVVGAYQVWELQSLQEKIARQEKGRDKLNEQYDALLANFVEPAEDPALVTRLRRLSEDAAQKQKLHDFLVKESGKSLFSFASVLDGLADNDIRNVWLTEIRISTDNKRYQLK